MIDTVIENKIILSGEFDSNNLEKIIGICMDELESFVIHFHMNAEMTATLFIKDGILQDAILGPYGGLKVLALLSDDVSGRFDLCEWQEPESRTINLALSSALLAAAVQFDENRYQLRKTIKGIIEHIEHHDDPFKLSGRLEKVGLEKLLFYVQGLHKACEIMLTISPEIRGKIFVFKDLVFDAQLAELSGIKAFGLILEHAKGEFTVTECTNPLPDSISLSISECIAAAKELV